MRGWTHAEEEALRVLSPLGGKACALAFGRSLKSIERKAASLGVSLRRRSYGGNLGETSPATLRRVRELSEAQLCPACGFRFAGVKATGLCGLCHVKRLRAVHEEEIVKAEAQRELWAARSKLQRRRRELATLTQSGNGEDLDKFRPDSFRYLISHFRGSASGGEGRVPGTSQP